MTLISFSMFDGLVSGIMASAVAAVAKEDCITELRLRVGRPLMVYTASSGCAARMSSGLPYTVRNADIERILGLASDFSVYAVNDQLVKGYMARRGIRIGVAGEGVVEKGDVLTMKHISFLTLRIPHQIRDVADGVRGKVFADGDVKNTLVISPPSGGKTTMLRELARIASERYNTLIIDERYEIAAAERGVPTMDVGDCDVVSGVSKAVAYENTIRAMSPQVIVTDELFGRADSDAVGDIVRSGVKVFASLHGRNAESVLSSEAFAALGEVTEVYVVLSAKPRVGTVAEVLDAEEVRRRLAGG